jgi:DNA-binding NarL/FixJ family response regulator
MSVRLVVQSADRFSVVGLAGFLKDRPEITLVAEDPEVIVMAAYELTDELRYAALNASVPVVLVLNEIGDINAPTVSTLPRSAVTEELLLRSVLAAGRHTTPPVLVAERPQRVLTTRETEILRLMADGLATAKIARTLSCSERTVKNIFHGVTSRLNLRNRPHAVAYALRKGLI